MCLLACTENPGQMLPPNYGAHKTVPTVKNRQLHLQLNYIHSYFDFFASETQQQDHSMNSKRSDSNVYGRTSTKCDHFSEPILNIVLWLMLKSQAYLIKMFPFATHTAPNSTNLQHAGMRSFLVTKETVCKIKKIAT